MIEVEEFLEHHGVKGQHWGIRNKTDSSNKSSNRKKVVRNVAFGVGAAAVVVGGALIAHKVLRSNNARTLSQIRNVSVGQTAAKKVLDNSGNFGENYLMKTHPSKLTEAQRRHVLKLVAGHHLHDMKNVNYELNEGYKKLSTPIPKRKFIETDFWERLVK